MIVRNASSLRETSGILAPLAVVMLALTSPTPGLGAHDLLVQGFPLRFHCNMSPIVRVPIRRCESRQPPVCRVHRPRGLCW